MVKTQVGDVSHNLGVVLILTGIVLLNSISISPTYAQSNLVFAFDTVHGDIGSRFGFTVAAAQSARTWVVDTSGKGDYVRVQDAINVASPGDTVEIRPGKYSANPGLPFVTIAKPLSLVGTSRKDVSIETRLLIKANNVAIRSLTVSEVEIQQQRNILMQNVVVLSLGSISGTNITLRDTVGMGKWYGFDISGEQIIVIGSNVTFIKIRGEGVSILGNSMYMTLFDHVKVSKSTIANNTIYSDNHFPFNLTNVNFSSNIWTIGKPNPDMIDSFVGKNVTFVNNSIRLAGQSRTLPLKLSESRIVSNNFEIDVRTTGRQNMFALNKFQRSLMVEGAGNTFAVNEMQSVLVKGEDNLLIGNNIFGSAQDDGNNNTWFRKGAGNFWRNWTRPDDNGDEIADRPHALDGKGAGVDRYPLVKPVTLTMDLLATILPDRFKNTPTMPALTTTSSSTTRTQQPAATLTPVLTSTTTPAATRHATDTLLQYSAIGMGIVVAGIAIALTLVRTRRKRQFRKK